MPLQQELTQEKPGQLAKMDSGKKLVLFTGLCSLLLGISGLIGWHFDIPIFIQGIANSSPVLYLTSVCAALIGLSLLSLTFSCRKKSLAFAALALIPAALRLLEHLSRTDLGLLAIIPPVRAQLPVAPGIPSNTAMAFTLICSGLILYNWKKSTTKTQLIVAILGGLAISISLVVIIGYTIEIPHAYDWSHAHGMALRVGVLIFLLGLTVLRLNSPRSLLETVKFAPWVPIPIALSLVAGTLMLWLALLRQENSRIEEVVTLSANSARSTFHHKLEDAFDSVSRMASRAQSGKDYQKHFWLLDAKHQLDQEFGPSSVEYIEEDPEQVHTLTYPHGIALTDNPSWNTLRQETLNHAKSLGTVVISRILPMEENRPGFLMIVPIFDNHRYCGAIISTYDLKRLLSGIFSPVLLPGYSVQLLQDDIPVFDRPAARESSPLIHRFQSTLVLEARSSSIWKLRIIPTNEELRSLRSVVPMAVLISGSIITLLITLLVYLFHVASLKAEQALTLERRSRMAGEVARNMQEAVLLVTVASREVIYTNPTFKQRFSHSQAVITDLALSALKDREQSRIEWDGVCDYGTQVACLINLSSFRHEEAGKIAVIVINDVTEKRAAKLQLQDYANQLKHLNADLENQVARRTRELRISEERNRSLIAATTSVVWTSDAEGRFADKQDSWQQYTGQTPEEYRLWGYYQAVHTQDRERLTTAWKHARNAKAPLLSEIRVWNVISGQYHHCRVRAVPLTNESGVIREWVGTNEDIHEQKLAHEAMIQSESRFRLVVNSIPQIVWTAAPNGDCEYFNESWYQYTQLDSTRFYPDVWKEVVDPADLPQVVERWTEAIRTENPFTTHLRLRRASDGQSRWFLTRATPIRDAEGNIIKWLGASTDVDDQKRLNENLEERVEARTKELSKANAELLLEIENRRHAEEKLEKARAEAESSLEEKEVLLREIHHRVKNNLNIVASLLDMQARSLNDPATKEAFTESKHRVLSMGLIHEKLYQSKNLARINFQSYLRELVSALYHSYGFNPKDFPANIQVGQAQLTVDMAIPCSLIINELVSNSLKHAFSGRKAGHIQIKFNQEGDQANGYTLEVQDDGVGLPDHFTIEASNSLGLKLVKTLARQIGGELEQNNDHGAHFRVHFAMSEKEEVMHA